MDKSIAFFQLFYNFDATKKSGFYMKTIFLIDDDSDDREIFNAALGSLNFSHKYIEAKDGQEALQMIADRDFKVPDIIFLDLNMPKVNGYEVLLAVKKIPHYTQVPIIIYSTSSLQSEIDKCMNEGATAFMTKHSSYEVLCNELSLIFERL